MRFRRTRAGDLVVTAFFFAVPPDIIFDERAITATGAAIEGHGHFIPAQDSTPALLIGEIDHAEAAGMGAGSRCRFAGTASIRWTAGQESWGRYYAVGTPGGRKRRRARR